MENKRIIMSGENLIDAQPNINNQSEPTVSFTLDRLGSQKFGQCKYIANVLDFDIGYKKAKITVYY